MSEAEVIIVGGGVTGCAIACFLAKAGVKSQVIEKDAIGSAASGMAPGVLSPLTDMNDPEWVNTEGRQTYIDFKIKSFYLLSHIYKELQEESGVDVRYRRTHMLNVAFSESDEERMKARLYLQQERGFNTGWLDRHVLINMYSGIGPKVRGALCWYDQAEIDAYRLTLAYMQAAESHGASIRQGTVTGIRHRGTRVTGVMVSGRLIEGDAIVLAMGPWSKTGGSWLGISVPVEPVRGEIVVMEPASILPPYLIQHGLNYIIPKTDGTIMAGTTFERVGMRNRVTRAGQDSILRGALSLAHVIDKARMVYATSGLRPNSKDNTPILGRAPGWDNAYVAAGHGPSGVILSAATGRAMAELIINGYTGTDIEPFDPARFV